LVVNTNANPANSVQVSSNSSLSAQATEAGGSAGGITIDTKQLSLENESQISTSNVSGVSQGVTLRGLDTLEIRNSLISASTETGTAGSLSVKAADSVQLSGTLANGKPAGLSIEATSGGTAGNLRVETGQMSVSDGAQVTVSSSEGAGNAGTLEVTARNIFLNNQGKLIAETAGGEGGNINLRVRDDIVLHYNSEISAEARGTGNGGNISIDAGGFILAILSENSDIVANAYQGRGGNITGKAASILGFRESIGRRTPESDFTASSELGIDGTVQVNTRTQPQVQVTLPRFTGDQKLITSACATSQEDKLGKFTVTGRGGLPQSPTEVISPDMVQDDLGTPVVSNPPTGESIKPSPSRPQQQLVEAQGWVIDDNGVVTLVAAAPTVTPHSLAIVPPSCEIGRTTGKKDEGVGSSEQLAPMRSR
jgi:large exoprotein involved in heme utilization and adhesion